ncbi:hypothetical protein SDRG_03129 [Saprolegnia diclina VS20]|uniref:Uncharacterized protein n=1 Tax=Saprolegnia diclina (strain VS20) TaxID=1156394 RepID=T0QYD6_SAPDV|nr:hypothetical protein SDRG_03129 [Saprolegnia diclina VS20]EQC39701.1 hypothetical protein SDRG_03129 [Saprolegnia diclina VS20]|eukprot:XP_008606973.1 hypothetical protein SDRG_03129 [Saprolegnia diclina VS20]
MMRGRHEAAIDASIGLVTRKEMEDMRKQALDLAASGRVILTVAPDQPPPAYYVQGDLDFYSDDNLKVRMSLRPHPTMARLTRLFWKAIVVSPAIAMNYKGYEQLFLLIHKVLIELFALDESVAQIQEDWSHDVSAHEAYIEYPPFHESLFELIDIWCDSIEIEDYANMLYLLWKSVMDYPPSGGRAILRHLSDVSFKDIVSLVRNHPLTIAEIELKIEQAGKPLKLPPLHAPSPLSAVIEATSDTSLGSDGSEKDGDVRVVECAAAVAPLPEGYIKTSVAHTMASTLPSLAPPRVEVAALLAPVTSGANMTNLPSLARRHIDNQIDNGKLDEEDPSSHRRRTELCSAVDDRVTAATEARTALCLTPRISPWRYRFVKMPPTRSQVTLTSTPMLMPRGSPPKTAIVWGASQLALSHSGVAPPTRGSSSRHRHTRPCTNGSIFAAAVQTPLDTNLSVDGRSPRKPSTARDRVYFLGDSNALDDNAVIMNVGRGGLCGELMVIPLSPPRKRDPARSLVTNHTRSSFIDDQWTPQLLAVRSPMKVTPLSSHLPTPSAPPLAQLFPRAVSLMPRAAAPSKPLEEPTQEAA